MAERLGVALLLIGPLGAVGVYCTRRVIVAWVAYFVLRRKPAFQRPRHARWLWLHTLAVANGGRLPGETGHRLSRTRLKAHP